MIEIVRAEELHVPDIGKLWWEFMLFHQDIDPWFTPLDDATPGFLESHVRGRYMKSENGLVLVAVEDSKVVAYSLSEIRSRGAGMKQTIWGFIDHLAVTAEYRRRGVGEKMLAEITNWFKSKGVKRVELQVASENPTGLPFWQKHGFRVYLHSMYREI
jgi:ribosomal protein S18 acetylase RimI-like enzyme